MPTEEDRLTIWIMDQVRSEYPDYARTFFHIPNTPVGVFPGGATPDTGLLDLCGNVWEWTATPWSESDGSSPAAGADDGERDARRVVRGGSWDSTQALARLGYRNHHDPAYRSYVLGFRVCRASPI